MRIAGLVKNSFVDYPGVIAAVVFVPGCNMDCWYCHNRHLWREEQMLDPADIDAFLERHKGFIDGLVVSGGEPTLQRGLKPFIKRAKEKGYLVKLDTNGLKPDVLQDLLASLDYVAMDIKAPPGEISRVVSFALDDSPIWQSAKIIMDSGVDYEFRTTFMPFLDTGDIAAIAARIAGAKRYALQQYRKIEGTQIQPDPHPADTVRQAGQIAKKHIENVVIRGI